MSRLIYADALMETINSHCYPVQHDMTSIEPGMTRIGILQAIQEQPTIKPGPQWIPVSERLPEEDGIYIVDDRRHGKSWVHTVGYMKRSNSWCEQHGIYYDDKYGRYDEQDKIVAWMPLPEPYREEDR